MTELCCSSTTTTTREATAVLEVSSLSKILMEIASTWMRTVMLFSIFVKTAIQMVALHVDVPCCASGACSSNVLPPSSK
ncbi:unnamed protein product [Clavelina lepadiformis]|uniref:Uncharacterized protein n=1 Tax=Clavelina lepadiformis TaxID=159417 RepID=A0ABP0GF25_CLALP